MRGTQSAPVIRTNWLELLALFFLLGGNCLGSKLTEVTIRKQTLILAFRFISLLSDYICANCLALRTSFAQLDDVKVEVFSTSFKRISSFSLDFKTLANLL